MDKADKMRGQLKGSLKPRDDLFRPTTAAKVPAAAVPASVSQQHTERVTLPLTTAQKDLLDALGKKLQRQRIRKDQDLNRNTIIRALIGILDEGFFDGVSVSSEVELENWVKNRLKK